MRWYWIALILIGFTVLVFLFFKLAPSHKGKTCKCIKDKVNRLKLTAPSPLFVTSTQYDAIIEDCCKPPIREQQYRK